MKEIMLPYVLICWLLLKLKLVKRTTQTYFVMISIGFMLIISLFLSHRLWSPADITSSTTVKAPHSVLSPAVGFEIDTIYVEHNQFVEKDQLLYSLVDTSQSAQLDAAVSQENAALSAIEASISQVSSAKIAVTQAKRKQANILGLQEHASQDHIDEAEERVIAADERLTMAIARKNTAKAQLEGAIANVQQAEFNLSRLTVRAPYDGMVTHVYIDQGTRIGAMHLYNTGKRFVEMRIPDQAYANIEPGQFSEFYVDAYPGEVFRARVHSIVRATGEATGNLFPGEQSVAQHIMRGQPNLGRTVILEFEDPAGYHIPIGSTGSAWISANKPHSFFGFIDIIGGATVRLMAAESYIKAL